MSQPHSFKYDPEFLQIAGPLLAQAAQRPQPALHDVEQHRINLDTLLRSLGQRAPPQPVTTTTHSIATRNGATIDVIQVSPEQRSGAAALHIHGGGMVSGSASAFVASGAVSAVAVASGVDMFCVEYRLAPEHRYDSLVDDCYDALTWLSSHASSLGIDNTRIGIYGESAGGGIAAGVALQARDSSLSPPLRKQILIYPMLDDRNIHPDDRLSNLALWSYTNNLTGWSALLGPNIPATDSVDTLVKYASPARVENLSHLPDTYIDVGQLDIFLDEDLEFARRLHKAGVQVDLHVYKGLPHAWELFGGLSTQTGKNILSQRIAALKSI